MRVGVSVMVGDNEGVRVISKVFVSEGSGVTVIVSVGDVVALSEGTMV